MTTLSIIANYEKKRLKCYGTVAAGEHVAVTVTDGAQWIGEGTALRLRVLFGPNIVAVFPFAEGDAWTAAGTQDADAACELNLNTLQAEKYLKRGGTCLWILDDVENHTLYATGEFDILPWPKRRGVDEPIDLDGYPLLLDEINGLKDAFEAYQQTVAQTFATKQDVIFDLQAIRNGAAAGATAVQPEQIARFVDDAEYKAQYGEQNKPAILLKHGSYVIVALDATPFVKDGMVSKVEIVDGNLIVTFNTDSGKQPISVPLTDIFDPDNYYDKTATDGLLAPKVDRTELFPVWTANVGYLQGDIVIHENALYISTSTQSPDAEWDPTKWSLATGAQVLAALRDYDALANKPSVNGVTLSGNKTGPDLGLKNNFAIGSGLQEVSNNLYAYKGVDGTSTEGQTVYTLGAVASVGSKLYTWDGTTLTDTLKTVSSVNVGTGRIYTSVIPAVYYERAASNDVSRPPTVNVATVAPSTNAVTGDVADAKSVWDELLKLAPDWKTSTAGGSYVKYDVVRYNHNYYYNKTGTNTNTVPSGDTTNWGSLANLAAFFAKFLPLTGGNISGRLGIGRFEFEVLDEDETLGINDGEGYFKFGKGGWLLRHGVAAVLSDIGIPAFDPTATYAVGAKVVYGNAVWNCTTAISTAGAWTGTTNWTKLFDLDTGAPASGGTKLITNGQAYTEFSKYLKLTGNQKITGAKSFSDWRAYSDIATPDHHITFGMSGIPSTPFALIFQNGEVQYRYVYALPHSSGTLAFLESPAFTGTPTAPTAAAGTNTTQVATTAFVKEAIPYTLGTPIVIDTASPEVVEGQTVYYGAATLANRTANIVQVTAATALDELRITFPAATSGKVRDFGLRVEIGTGSAALAAPALVPIAPTGETIKIENNAKEIPALADGTATAKGVTLLYFSENAPGVFVVKGEQVEEVA